MKTSAFFFGMVLLAGAAQAQVAQDKTGLYLGFTAGYSKAIDACEPGQPTTTDTCDAEGSAWGVLAGYQLGRNLAIEGAYNKFNRVVFTGGETETVGYDLVLVPILPTSDRGSLFGKVGLFRSETNLFGRFGNSDHLETGWTLGAGAQWEFTRSFAVRAEWQMYATAHGSVVTDPSDIHRIGVGLIWRIR